MRLHRKLAILAAFLVMVSIGLAGATAGYALKAAPTAVAAVDLAKLFESLKERQRVLADMQTRQEQLRQNEETKKKELASIQGELDLLVPGSESYRQKENQRDKAFIELQTWAQYESRKLRIDFETAQEALLKKANETIGKVATENGYDLVLFKNQALQMRNEANQNAAVNIRFVAWSNEANDLTNQVIQRMNNEYAAGAQ